METVELQKEIEQLKWDIQQHDFYYEYSDDSRAYRNGGNEERNIIQSIRSILTKSPEVEESLLQECVTIKTDSKLQNQIKAFFSNAKR